MATTDYSYLGSGKIRIREYQAAAGLVEIGNCSKLDYSVTEDTKKLVDFTQPGGGTYNQVNRISSVDLTFTAHDLSPANIARGLYGTTSPVTAAAVTDEVHTAYLGSFIQLNSLPSAIGTVKDSAGTTTYVLGTDYTVDVGGINIPAAGSAITDASTVKITYTKAATDVVQALVTSGKEYEIVFHGLNEARSGKVSVIQTFRVKLTAFKQMSLIGADYAGLDFTGNVLKDSTKVGGGLSQYLKAEIER